MYWSKPGEQKALSHASQCASQTPQAAEKCWEEASWRGTPGLVAMGKLYSFSCPNPGSQPEHSHPCSAILPVCLQVPIGKVVLLPGFPPGRAEGAICGERMCHPAGRDGWKLPKTSYRAWGCGAGDAWALPVAASRSVPLPRPPPNGGASCREKAYHPGGRAG